MSIWWDRSQRSTVVGCSACGVRDVFASPAAADSWAVAHLTTAHPKRTEDTGRDIRASQQRARRHADD